MDAFWTEKKMLFLTFQLIVAIRHAASLLPLLLLMDSFSWHISSSTALLSLC